MFRYKLDTYSFDCPSSWEEVTLGQWIGLQKVNADDTCAILEVMTGVARSVWMDTNEVDVAEKLLPALSFIGDDLHAIIERQQVPTSVTIDGEVYNVPADLTRQTFGQKLTFQQQLNNYMNKEGATVDVAFYPIAIAIYLWPKRPWMDTDAMAFADKVRRLPVVQAVPIGNFFLNNFLRLSDANMTASLIHGRMMK